MHPHRGDRAATPAAQVQPERFAGFEGNLRPPVLDRGKARWLLAEAGWGQGFRIRLSGTNDRLVSDERILQAVAQMWQRVAITTEVEPLPSTVFCPVLQRRSPRGRPDGLDRSI